MARMIPAVIDPGTPSLGERDAFQRLESDPIADGWTVIHSLYLPNHVRQISGELDFVVLVPGKGILCLEIKAAAGIARRGRGVVLWQRAEGGSARTLSSGVRGDAQPSRDDWKRYPPAAKAVFWTAVVLPIRVS